MRLTSTIGLGARALLSAGVAAGTLLASAFVMTVFGAALLLVVPVLFATDGWLEGRILWGLTAGAAAVLPAFALVVVYGIRLEQRRLLERTVPVTAIDAGAARAVGAAATRLAAQFGVTKPQVRLHPASTPFAYTTYRPDDPLVAIRRTGTPTVVVSKGLVRTLSRAEAEAVLAHEFAHISNDDLQLISWLLVPLFAAEFLHDGREEATSRKELLEWLLVTVALIGVGVFSRGRELAADRAAVAATGDPSALATPLERLDGCRTPRPTTDLRTHARSTNAVSVVPTLGADGSSGGLRSTHPPLRRDSSNSAQRLTSANRSRRSGTPITNRY